VVGDNFVSLLVEDGNPVLHLHLRAGMTGRHAPTIDTCDLEEIVQLLSAELKKQIGQELSTCLADARVAQGPSVRSAQMADASDGVSPDRRFGPLIKVHASEGVAVEDVPMSERLPDIVQEQQRPFALAVLGEGIC
jgi:hypothetical protein